MSKRLAALTASALLLCGVASAQPRPALNGPTQGDLNTQSNGGYKIADRRLNAAYKALLGKASPQRRQRLQNAQRDWVRFRDSNCAAMTGSRDGSVYPTVFALCLEEMTDARTKALNAQLHCREGDLSCGGPLEP